MLSWYTILFYVVLNESYWPNNFNKMSVTYALKHAFRYSSRHCALTTNIQNVKLNHKILVLVEKKGGKFHQILLLSQFCLIVIVVRSWPRTQIVFWPNIIMGNMSMSATP